MAMKNKICDFFRKKIEDFLPSDEPETEKERLYEKGKKKLYALHMEETDIFYVDNIWIEEEKIHLHGEFAKGDFHVGEDVDFLDQYAGHLFYGTVEDVIEERSQSIKGKRGFFMILSGENREICEESFVCANFLIKKKTD